jgi:hypothetical protein
MPLYIVRPGHLHAASKVLSATTEAGLTVAPATADGDNAGALRLRTSTPFTPTADLTADVRLQTGGAPKGYAIPGVSGSAPGASIIWKPSTDVGTLWRGYTDGTSLVRVAHPATYDSTHGPPSTPRRLSGGKLGYVVPFTSGYYRLKFHRIDYDYSFGQVNIDDGSTNAIFTNAYRPDFVVLPSGRLVVASPLNDSLGGVKTWYSDDDGATWAALGYSALGVGGAAREVLCLEVVGETLVMLRASATAAIATQVAISVDGGCTFSVVDSATTLRDPRTCVAGDQVIAVSRSGTGLYAYPIAPGGGIGSAVTTNAPSFSAVGAVARRDDGTLWAYGWNASNTTDQDMSVGVSLDDGLTWTAPTSARVLDLAQAAYGTVGIDSMSAGSWNGFLVVVARINSNAGSDAGLMLLVFGEWGNIVDGLSNQSAPTYATGYVAVDYPQNLGWTRTDVGVGATLTNQPYLNITSTAAANSSFRASATMWASGTADTRKVRFRCRVNTGGSVADNRSRLQVSMDDGVNRQMFFIRFSTTTASLLDYNLNVLGSNATIDMTKWTDFVVAFAHDTPAAGGGQVSIWYRQDADLTYTAWQASTAVPEQAATVGDFIDFGGSVAGAASWDIAYLGIRTTSDSMHNGITNPDDLVGRPLSAAADSYMTAGVFVGGYSTGGVPTDTYTVSTIYGHGKENAWAELRPSRYVASSADAASWSWIADAGATDLFRGTLVALFGTNFRTATFQMNAANSWGAPSVSVSLDATVESFTVGAGVRGLGYVGPTVSPNWRPGQYRSDGDAHRWFLDIGGDVYEITDNDASRIFVADVDFSASSGTARIFGDRMASTLTFAQYRYMRILVGAQNTADDEYRLGTPILDSSFTPAQLYDHGFIDRVEPRVDLVEADAGYRASARRGPRRASLAIQWPPLDAAGTASDLDLRLRDLYAALEGSHRPVVVWRDSTDQRTLGLYRVREVFSASNVWGERGTSVSAVTRIDQLVLEEEL